MAAFDYEALKRLALAHPEVAESTSYGTPALKVRGKLMVRLKEDGTTAVVRTTWEARERAMTLDPTTFFVTDHYRDHPWVLVRLAGLDRIRAKEAVAAAWALAAPRSLVAKRERGGDAADAKPARTVRRSGAPRRLDVHAAHAFCAALPGATLDFKWRFEESVHPTFSVGGKMFAMFTMKSDELVDGMLFKAADERFLELTDREGIAPSRYLGRAKWVTLDRVGRLDAAELETLLREAHATIVAKLSRKKQLAIMGGPAHDPDDGSTAATLVAASRGARRPATTVRAKR